MAKIKISKQIFDDDVSVKSEKLKINNKTVQNPIK